MENKKYIIIGLGCLMSGVFIGSYFMNNDKHPMNDGTEMYGSQHESMSMDSMMHDMKMSLNGKTGEEFDREFLKQMIVHHEGAVTMAEDVLKNSTRPELLQLAKEIITAQDKEINQMKEWQTKWFK